MRAWILLSLFLAFCVFSSTALAHNKNREDNVVDEEDVQDERDIAGKENEELEEENQDEPGIPYDNRELAETGSEQNDARSRFARYRRRSRRRRFGRRRRRRFWGKK